MALEESRFFDAVDNDLSYSADEFAEFFRLFLSDGVRNLGNCLKASNDAGMTLKVDYGEALVQGYLYTLKNDGTGTHKLTLDYEATSKRIDRIVLRLDKSIPERTIRLVIKKGVSAANPVPPELTRNSNVYELSLARVNVSTNVTTITEIIDERPNTDLCGMINSLITLDTADMQQQFNAVINNLNTYVNEALPFVVVPKGTNIPVANRVQGRYYFIVKDYITSDQSTFIGEWQDWEGKVLYPESRRSEALPVAEGGTGAKIASQALTNLGASPSNHTHTASDVGASSSNHTHTAASIGAASSSHSHSASEVGAASSSHTHTASSIGAASSSHTHASITGTLGIANGGTGSTSMTGAQKNLGFVYSSSTPSSPATGTIWLKPV